MQKLWGFRSSFSRAGLMSAIAAFGIHSSVLAQSTGSAAGQAAAIAAAPQRAPSLFDTTAIPIGAKRFGKEWARARQDASWHPALQQLVAPVRNASREDQIRFVQRAVHRRIRWRSDATEWGVHDYWASAAQTLERGVGDMEDRAILKMHALKLLGFPARDLYLTLGRDKVGGPMAVLIVRSGNRLYMLDDLGGRPVPVDQRRGFTPQLSFGSRLVWAHASRLPQGSAAVGAAPE